MTAPTRRITRALGPWLTALALATLARPAAAAYPPEPELALTLDRELLVAAAPKESKPAAAPQKPVDTSLDFDLLGAPAPPVIKFDDEAMKRRRTMLDLHQKVGLGLVALQLATTVVGQLNYSDKYGSNPAVTGKYELPHTVLDYSTLGVFAVNGSLALLAPSNPVKKKDYDRMTIHKVGMAIATAGMVAQGVVGIRADQLEGRIDQASVARTHLVIGYVTLAAVAVAVGALVF